MSKNKLNRRDVIKASALSVAGLTLSGFSSVNPLNVEKENVQLQHEGKVAFTTCRDSQNIVVFMQ